MRIDERFRLLQPPPLGQELDVDTAGDTASIQLNGNRIAQLRPLTDVPPGGERLLEELCVYGTADDVGKGLARWQSSVDLLMVGLSPGEPQEDLEALVHAGAPRPDPLRSAAKSRHNARFGATSGGRAGGGGLAGGGVSGGWGGRGRGGRLRRRLRRGWGGRGWWTPPPPGWPPSPRPG